MTRSPPSSKFSTRNFSAHGRREDFMSSAKPPRSVQPGCRRRNSSAFKACFLMLMFAGKVGGPRHHDTAELQAEVFHKKLQPKGGATTPRASHAATRHATGLHEAQNGLPI